MNDKNPTEIKMVEYFNEHWYKITIYRGEEKEVRMIPSVTTKLGITDKPFLAKWRGDIGNREADMRLFEAQERGSRIHHGWEVMTLGGLIIYNPWQRPNYTEDELKQLKEEHLGNVFVVTYQDEMLALIKLKAWVEAVKPTFHFSEKTVYSLTNNDAGTVDNGVFIKGGTYQVNGKTPLVIPEGNYILDLKTGNQVGDSAFQQTAAYLKCAEEMIPDLMPIRDWKGTIILHTSSKNKGSIEGLSTMLRLRPEVEKDYEKYRVASRLWEMNNEDAAPRVFEFPSLIKLNGGLTNETSQKTTNGL